MPKTRKVIGEGSYGCVQEPSLHCAHLPKPNFDYNGYVSKLMKTKRAEEELAEFVKFHRYDPNDEYHLGTPIMCKPDLTDAGVMADVEQCKKLSTEIKAKPADYDLLVMKYGGPDLKIFCKSKINQFLKTKKEEKSDKFWLEVHHLIKGLQFFRDSGIVHNDLKPQNILYDTKTNKLMFIDFGLMQTKREIIRTSKNNTNNQAVFHWSYPLDSGFMDYNDYSKYRRGITNGYRTLVKDELIGMLVSDSKKNTAKLNLKRPEAFELFFSYINPSGKDMTTDAKYAFVEDFFDGLNEMVKLDYDDYLDDAIDSIDVYGLGFTLQYILNCFKRHNAVSQDFFNLASALFSKMYDSNPDNRELNIYELLDEYESILLGTGVLTRLNKRFDSDNELVDSAPMPSPIMRKAKKENGSVSSNSLSEELESIAYMDATPKVSLQPTAKVSLQPTAKVSLQPTAKVSLQPTAKVSLKPTKKVTAKSCPVGKELNPKTGRCIKQCASNETRNTQGRCVKQTRRIYSSSSRTRSRSSSRSRNIKEDLLNQIFPELKKITPFTKVTTQKVTDQKVITDQTVTDKKDANPTIKINKTFPYENRSKSKTRSNK
jgi:serine/threonine protein kinase